MAVLTRMSEAIATVARCINELDRMEVQHTERELEALEGARLELRRLLWSLSSRHEQAVSGEADSTRAKRREGRS